MFTIDEEDSTKGGGTAPGTPSAARGAVDGSAEAGEGEGGGEGAEEGPGYEAVDAEFTLLPEEKARVSAGTPLFLPDPFSPAPLRLLLALGPRPCQSALSPWLMYVSRCPLSGLSLCTVPAHSVIVAQRQPGL